MRRRLVLTTTTLVLVAVIALAVPLAIAVRGVLTARATDAVQGVTEQAGLLLDVTARTCSELQLRVVQLGEAPVALTVLGSDGTLVATTTSEPVVVDIAAIDQAVTRARVARTVADGRIVVTAPLSTSVCARPLVLQATLPDSSLIAEVRSAWLAIAGVAGVVAVAAAALAGWSGRRTARPFEALATSARALGEGDFSARAPRSGLPEADAIAAALDGTAERLGRSVERSSAFTADASHQLRTPLTALRLQLDTAEALLTADVGAGREVPAGEVDDRARLRSVLAAAEAEADRLEATIEDLVALTRLDRPETEVELPALIAERLDAWRALAGQEGREVVVDVAGEVPAVRARPGAVAQVLEVLVDNALLHATGTIHLEVATGRGPRATAAPTPAAPTPAAPTPAAPTPAAPTPAAPTPAAPTPAAPTPAAPAAGEGAEEQRPGAGATVQVCVVDEGPGSQDYDRGGGKGLPLARSLAAAEGGQLTVVRVGPGTRACLLLPAVR